MSVEDKIPEPPSITNETLPKTEYNQKRSTHYNKNYGRKYNGYERREYNVEESLEKFDKEKDKSEWMAKTGSEKVVSEDGTIKSTAYDKNTSFFDTLSSEQPKQYYI